MNIFHQSSLPTFYDFFYISLCAVFCATLGIFYSSFLFLFIVITIICIALGIYHSKPQMLWISMGCVCIFLNLYYDHTQHTQFERHFINKPLSITGYVQDVDLKNGKKIITLITTQLHDTKNYSSYPYKIILYLPAKSKFIPIQSALEIHPVNFSKPSTLEYARYLKKEGIFASAYISSSATICILSKSPSINSCIHNISKKMEYPTSLLYKALFYGKKSTSALYHTLKQYFNYWGIAHYLARSGLHVTLVFILLLYVLGYIPLPWYIKQILLLGVLGILYFFTISSVSFIRACIFYTLSIFCNILKIQFHPLHVLNITLLGMIIYNPYLVLFLDFQLTFAATYILMWLTHLRIFAPNS